MYRFDSLILALEYIEKHLCDEIDMQELAKYAFSSLSGLQKQFRWVFNYSIKEYVSKRRLTVASKELIETDCTILQIAFKFGYKSPEVFTRAFKKIYGMRPSEYRRQKQYMELFPRIQISKTGNKGYIVYKDVSSLYDWLAKYSHVYVICFDVVGLIRINEISRDVGDKVLLEAICRIENAKENNMPLFRLGGDEFVVFVSNYDKKKCYDLERRVIEQNGTPIVYDGKEYPVILRRWHGKLPEEKSLVELSATLIHNVKNA
ncbi:helix-turn-helix domain-containing protein [Faecalimonas sp.]